MRSLYTILALFILVFAGCQSSSDPATPSHIPPSPIPPTTLPGIALDFTTIEQEDDYTWPWYDGNPRLFVARNIDELLPFSEFLSQKAQTELQVVDFENGFIVAVFRGIRATHDYQVTIQDVRILDNTIFVNAVTERPEGEVITATTYPYHVIRVDKNDIDLAEANVLFFLDGVEIEDVTLE